MTAEQFASFLPDPPDFDQGDGAWIPLKRLRGMLKLSETGLTKVRERFAYRFEARDAKRCVFVYGPYWLRMWGLYRAERGHSDG